MLTYQENSPRDAYLGQFSAQTKTQDQMSRRTSHATLPLKVPGMLRVNMIVVYRELKGQQREMVYLPDHVQ